jgi:hypothetical protein
MKTNFSKPDFSKKKDEVEEVAGSLADFFGDD